MWTHTRTAPSSSSSAEIASSKSRAVGGSIVKVGSVAQVEPAGERRRPRARPPRAPRAPPAGRSGARSPRSSISASSTSRATSGRPIRRRTRPWPAPRPVGATSTRSPGRAVPLRGLSTLIRRPRAKNGVAVRKRPRFSSTATIGAAVAAVAAAARCFTPPARSAASSASSRLGVSGSSSALTSGVTPAPRLTPPPPRLRPLGRKYSPTVMSSAPPFGSGSISWKTPLPNVRVPTTVARVAVLERAGDDLRRRRAAVVDEHDDRDVGVDRPAGRLVDVRRAASGPCVVTILPSGMKIEETITASLSRPPPLSRRSSTTPVGAVVEQLAHRVADLVVRAGGEAREPHVGDLAPVRAVRISDRTTGISTCARSSVSSRVPPFASARSAAPRVPAGPLIRVVDSSELAPAIERPLTCVITSPGRRPPRSAGEPS